MKELLTRNECTAMRGIAILAIVLHNYCHFISKIVQENDPVSERLWTGQEIRDLRRLLSSYEICALQLS